MILCRLSLRKLCQASNNETRCLDIHEHLGLSFATKLYRLALTIELACVDLDKEGASHRHMGILMDLPWLTRWMMK